MSIEALKGRLPAYAKDIKLNLSGVLSSSTLSEQQLWGTALAAAYAARNRETIEAIAAEAGSRLAPEALEAAKAAAAVMAMNNVYYRALHLLEQPAYRQMPARLRMNVIANPGVEKLDFELWSLAVSAINGCGVCLASHEKEVLAKGATREAVQDAIRIAAVVNAVAAVLEAETASPQERAAAA